jgi:uncharacterized protein
VALALFLATKLWNTQKVRLERLRMTHRFITAATLLTYVLFQAAPVLGQTVPTATPAVQTVSAPQRPATPALWVVKDADTTIYLFGTFHLLPQGLNWNFGAVKSAFDSADTLKLEIANIEAETPAIQAIMAEKSRLPVGQNLTDGLTNAQKTELARVIADAGIPADALSGTRPWVASMVLSITLYQKLGMDPTKGVDKTLDGLARARNIPVEGFETGAEQIGFFAAMTPTQERALLVSTLEDWDKAKSGLDDMVGAWSRGDANLIGRQMSNSLRGQPELERALLTDRNARWADWIGARMATPGTVFVAVGAGHLAGRDSVQSFLRKKGLRARRVASSVVAPR